MPLRIRSRIPTATVFIALTVLPSRGWAQTPGLLFGGLGPTSVVRATLPGGRTVTGRYAAVGDGRIGVRAETGTTDTVLIAELQALSVRGRHTRTGAMVGGAAGLAAGLFFGYFINAICDSSDCDGVEPYLLTIPLFGGGGALLGAAIGAAFPKWKQVYP